MARGLTAGSGGANDASQSVRPNTRAIRIKVAREDPRPLSKYFTADSEMFARSASSA